MEKRWHREWRNEERAALQIIGSGIIVAWTALALPVMGMVMSALVRHTGVLIGNAVAAILRQVFSAFGVFTAPHEVPETRLRLLPALTARQGLAVWATGVLGRRLRHGATRGRTRSPEVDGCFRRSM